MRIPYAPSDPTDPTPETQAIYDRIRERRNPRPLIPLDLALLHNPNIADGFSTLMGSIRTKSSLDLAPMELAVCYVAVLNKAVYEWTAHAPLALKAGVEREALEAVLKNDVRNTDVLSEEEVDVLEFTYQSTKDIEVKDELIEKLKRRYTDQQVMELTITVGAYNMVSRFLVALNVTESNGKGMKMPEIPLQQLNNNREIHLGFKLSTLSRRTTPDQQNPLIQTYVIAV
ncbi:hypothetical protein LTR37_019245 [Vermiconidia calcicola]|uniref:Uncharacterized protein n=1 Tax=Vermiconidia calcicola TaxID=1690605 RepID=A0ACC3MEJ8_9PEZI|nr:hypothetical protein LTR37_019245 [Vermiconidia calcicola]